MGAIAPDEAIQLTRDQLDLPSDVPARAFRVRRLDRPEGSYYLVVFGGERAAVAVATVDERGGDVGVAASLPGTAPHLLLDAAAAVGVAGADADAHVELVWTPCRASFSPLYPLWAVAVGEREVYVDAGGRVWDELGPGGPGGHVRAD